MRMRNKLVFTIKNEQQKKSAAHFIFTLLILSFLPIYRLFAILYKKVVCERKMMITKESRIG